MKRKSVTARVPQGSVLGLLLWNIAFDRVLRLNTEDSSYTICYADDILMMSTARGMFDAQLKVNLQLSRTVQYIRSLGLSIAEEKTEAVVFHRGVMRIQPKVKVGNTFVLNHI